MEIFIPSMGRSGNINTFKYISNQYLKKTKIAIIEKEYKMYRKEYGDNKVIVVPVKGISATRQWILENSSDKKIMYLDDDLTFQVRYEGIKLRDCSHADMDEMFGTWDEWLDEDDIAMVGVSRRGGNNRVEDDYSENSRAVDCYAFNRDILISENIKFRIPVMEDFDVTLQLLKKGYKNRIFYKFAHGQTTGSNAEGGCSSYRTSEVQRRAAIQLSQLHPGVVKVVAKKSSSSWKGMDAKPGIDGTVRTDVNIMWKKAYKPRRLKTEGIKKFL